MSLSFRQNCYADTTIKHPNIRNAISSPREFEFKRDILEENGLREDVDFKHQWCLHDDDFLMVADFFLIVPKIIIELDGGDHKNKIQRKLDAKRDRVVQSNGFIPIRIKTPMTKNSVHYWRVFFHEVYAEDDEEIEV